MDVGAWSTTYQEEIRCFISSWSFLECSWLKKLVKLHLLICVVFWGKKMAINSVSSRTGSVQLGMFQMREILPETTIYLCIHSCANSNKSFSKSCLYFSGHADMSLAIRFFFWFFKLRRNCTIRIVNINFYQFWRLRKHNRNKNGMMNYFNIDRFRKMLLFDWYFI